MPDQALDDLDRQLRTFSSDSLSQENEDDNFTKLYTRSMDSDACAQPPARLAGYPSLDDHDSFGMHMPRPDPVIMQEMANARELGLGRSPDAPSRALHSPAWNDDDPQGPRATATFCDSTGRFELDHSPYDQDSFRRHLSDSLAGHSSFAALDSSIDGFDGSVDDVAHCSEDSAGCSGQAFDVAASARRDERLWMFDSFDVEDDFAERDFDQDDEDDADDSFATHPMAYRVDDPLSDEEDDSATQEDDMGDEDDWQEPYYADHHDKAVFDGADAGPYVSFKYELEASEATHAATPDASTRKRLVPSYPEPPPRPKRQCADTKNVYAEELVDVDGGRPIPKAKNQKSKRNASSSSVARATSAASEKKPAKRGRGRPPRVSNTTSSARRRRAAVSGSTKGDDMTVDEDDDGDDDDDFQPGSSSSRKTSGAKRARKEKVNGRADRSLSSLTFRLMPVLERISKSGVTSVSFAELAATMDIPKRRIYDVCHVLSSIELTSQTPKRLEINPSLVPFLQTKRRQNEEKLIDDNIDKAIAFMQNSVQNLARVNQGRLFVPWSELKPEDAAQRSFAVQLDVPNGMARSCYSHPPLACGDKDHEDTCMSLDHSNHNHPRTLAFPAPCARAVVVDNGVRVCHPPVNI